MKNPKSRSWDWIVMLLLCSLAAELTFRVFFAARVGPEVFFYGTSWGTSLSPAEEAGVVLERAHDEFVIKQIRDEESVVRHTNSKAGYSKYLPNQRRFDIEPDTGERFTVQINKHGFRGRDFEIEKAEGVIRVVTLGASSTFGFYSRDENTYPVLLQSYLSAAFPDRRFEVINLGMPHMESHNILAILREEALPLSPDFVTFYEGFNDSARIREGVENRVRNADAIQKPWIARLLDHVASRLLSARFVVSMVSVDERVEIPPSFDADAEKIARGFIDNLSRMRSLCLKHGVVFLVAKQQANSRSFSRDEMAKLSYEQERSMIRKRFENGGPVTSWDLNFLVHARLMDALERWAASDGVPLLDVISSLDDRRNTMVSWVHLNREGNEVVAKEFFRSIAARLR
jgi:lysophospholipase L1-like esterase